MLHQLIMNITTYTVITYLSQVKITYKNDLPGNFTLNVQASPMLHELLMILHIQYMSTDIVHLPSR